MSRIATKPSAARTWSPSRTSRQKRQSSGSADPLLGHGRAADADELADRGVHEPGRVVVAVTAARTVDEHDVLAAELLAPAPEAGGTRRVAQARSALALDLARHRVGGGRRRSRPWRVGEDVHARDARRLGHRERPAKGGLVLGGEAD